MQAGHGQVAANVHLDVFAFEVCPGNGGVLPGLHRQGLACVHLGRGVGLRLRLAVRAGERGGKLIASGDAVRPCAGPNAGRGSMCCRSLFPIQFSNNKARLWAGPFNYSFGNGSSDRMRATSCS